MKNCKYCMTEINTKAKLCPNCRKPQGSSVLRIFLGVLIGLIILIAFANSIANSGLYNDYTNNSGNYITLSQFNQIESGMTYEQVKNIIGSEGTVMSESQVEDYSMIIYYWYGQDGISNANFNFQNGELINKTQIGLD